MLHSAAADRWRPGWRLAMVVLSLGVLLIALANTLAALRGPRWLGYEVASAGSAHLWRVTTVWPSSYAWEVGLRPGTLLHADSPPVTTGTATVDAFIYRRWQTATMPLRPAAAEALVPFALVLAVVIFAIGALTLLFARARRPALLLLLFCLAVALGACGIAAFEHGATWGDVLFETCIFAVLPPLTPALATGLPPGGRTVRLSPTVLGALGAVLCALLILGYVRVALHPPTRTVTGLVFVVSQAVALGLWFWRARPEWRRLHGPEYRLVMLGLSGAFGSLAILSILPALLGWYPPWPREAGALALVLFPAGLSWALLRYRMLEFQRTLQRVAISVAFLAIVLVVGLLLVPNNPSAVTVIVVLAGIVVPLAQRGMDRLLPDARASYAALIQRSGERLGLAVEVGELHEILDDVRRGLGLAGLRLRQGEVIMAKAGDLDRMPSLCLAVRHNVAALATLEVGQKLRHDDLFVADRQVLALLSQQLGAFLARQQLVLRLSDTVARLEETQERLLTARRLERERLGQDLHRGPLQDALLLITMLPLENAAAATAGELERGLRAILTETASATLRDLGLPAALRGFMAYLAPHVAEQGCVLRADIDDAVCTLASDESFALYQLAHEALANAVRHSRARTITVSLRAEQRAVILEVRDDGRGLPDGWERARVDHRGLRDALDLVGAVRDGVAAAGPGAGGGTVVRAQVPWRYAAGDGGREHAAGQIRVLVAEDHAAARRGLRQTLSEDPLLDVVAEAVTGHEILSLVLQHEPDVVLLDLDLPGQGGLDALRAIGEHVARPPRTLVLSAGHDEEYTRRARELGAIGVLTKGCDGEELRQAVHRAAAGPPVTTGASV